MVMKTITLEEYEKAGEEFFPKYEFVASKLPEDTKPEQVLKVMEALAGVAMKNRVDDKLAPFGFNKEKKNADVSSN